MLRQASDDARSGGPGGRSRGHEAAAPRGETASELLTFVRAVTEGMALLVGLLALETLFLGRGAYAALDVHPFWLPVILVSLQHGLYGGVATAGLASWLMEWPLRPPGVDISTYNLEMAHLPIQWLLYALLIGLYRQSERRQQAEQAREVARLRHRNRVFAEEIRRVDDELWRFEVAAAAASPAEPYGQQAPAIGGKEPDGQSQASVPLDRRYATRDNPASALVRSVAGLLGIGEARLFLQGPDGEYRDVSGSAPCPVLGSVLGADHPLVCRLVDTRDPVVAGPVDGVADAITGVAVRDQTASAPRGLIAMCGGGADEADLAALRRLADATLAVLAQADACSRDDLRDDAIGGAP